MVVVINTPGLYKATYRFKLMAVYAYSLVQGVKIAVTGLNDGHYTEIKPVCMAI